MSSRHSGFAIALLPVLVILLIAGAGTFYFLKTPKGKVETEDSQPPADWPVYQNETYGYEVSYPPNFHAQQDNEPPYPPPPATKTFTFKYDNGEWCDFMILASGSIEGFKGEISSIREQGKDTESLTTLAGMTVFVFDAQGGDAIDRTYYIDQNNPRLRVGYNYRPAGKYSQECADVVAKMLASFRLLN